MDVPQRTRKCSREKDFDPLAKQSKQVCLPIEPEEYHCILDDATAFRHYLDGMIERHPELFPGAIQHGYSLHDKLPASRKLPGIRLRRIAVAGQDGKDDVFAIRPSFVLPYMTGHTDEVEKALFLRRWAVPYWALAYVFGHDEQYWYCLENRLGRNSVVGTTVKDPAQLPTDVLADEKHSRLNGDKAYIATTVGSDCVLGASLSLSADEVSLTEAYTHFKTEAQDVDPAYAPQTVNIDGWSATQLAWQALFPKIIVILCFLHSFIKIRDCCKRLKDHYAALKTRVWNAYHAADPAAFIQRIAELEAWAVRQMPAGSGLEAVLKLCQRAPAFVKAYAYPTAYRTSNMLDRHLDSLARYLDSCRYFHGHLLSAEYGCRAWALAQLPAVLPTGQSGANVHLARSQAQRLRLSRQLATQPLDFRLHGRLSPVTTENVRTSAFSIGARHCTGSGGKSVVPRFAPPISLHTIWVPRTSQSRTLRRRRQPGQWPDRCRAGCR